MLVQGTLMHVDESLTSDRFLKFLAEEAPRAHYFVAQPPEDIIMTAAIDWRVIVPKMDVVEDLSAALWKGYESLVRPLQADALGRTPLIFVKMRNAKGEYDQFTIGKDFKKKEGLSHRMRETAAILASNNHEEAVLREIERTNGSDYWQKIC
ncbi:hypothetical protein [Geomonas sp.]|uniref:hypothetical protein n=1 Tax=Geomonas sp. TaxID=2651584 RepID=UPI002B47C2F3|nr:hypothetical protein [Geomonas sp.]HJV34322.1 hypothetical protein [Geomonas sp.]